jgi:hypothetical protein
MKLLFLIAFVHLPLAVIAIPATGGGVDDPAIASNIEARDTGAEAVGLVKRGTEYCDIVNVNTKVNCRSKPRLDSKVVKTLDEDRKNVKFTCYSKGDDVHGNR